MTRKSSIEYDSERRIRSGEAVLATWKAFDRTETTRPTEPSFQEIHRTEESLTDHREIDSFQDSELRNKVAAVIRAIDALATYIEQSKNPTGYNES